RIVAGIFGGVIGALVLTIVADVVPYARRARGTALVAAAFSLAAVMGVPLGLWFAAHYSWRMPFLVLAAFSVIVWAVAWRLGAPLGRAGEGAGRDWSADVCSSDLAARPVVRRALFVADAVPRARGIQRDCMGGRVAAGAALGCAVGGRRAPTAART